MTIQDVPVTRNTGTNSRTGSRAGAAQPAASAIAEPAGSHEELSHRGSAGSSDPGVSTPVASSPVSTVALAESAVVVTGRRRRPSESASAPAGREGARTGRSDAVCTRATKLAE
ncbi:hypothetical protein GCM10022223_09580 [Kineosporia mesophila]|uniref:Uncharacterized protein n=1 Tax=Kineosporia mesophila TaxID=566012 RepID=A0ABP6Z315_9ACTN|nr:hypothetical protein [Kineosporia mesophila]MCD5353876.1 hypothetical protein [Kineosporia mesophila]